jgi:hypothetical protein
VSVTGSAREQADRAARDRVPATIRGGGRDSGASPTDRVGTAFDATRDSASGSIGGDEDETLDTGRGG